MMETRSTCAYCGVGCGLIIESEGRHIAGVRGDPEHPANFGRLCSKGASLHLTATPEVLSSRRLLVPRWREDRAQAWQEPGWEGVQQRLVERLLALRAAHGPEALGFYISGQLLTEDYHAFNKLARGLWGTPHIDSNSRLCMSSAVVGYKKALGADAPPCSYEDIEQASCLFIAGANTAWAHPILFRRIEAAKAANPALRIVVADPRRTETAEFADLHLALRPGSDVALFQAMLHQMIWQGWIRDDFIAAHTEGFEAVRGQVQAMTPARAAQLCDLPEAQIIEAARLFAQSPATLSLYCMGLNQSSAGTDKNQALIQLHLASGQIGRPGCGPFSLTGQPNAMGGREAGGMATLLPGHRDPASAADRAEVAALWGVDRLPEGPGKTAVEMFEAAAAGEIKALWIACTDPAQSLPNQALVRAALQRCELVVLQDAFSGSATAEFAHVLLPAATWGEKEGTVTNSERRISRVRAAVPPPGEARSDWQIVRDLARRLEHALRPAQPSLFAWDRPEQAWLEHREATKGRDLDIGGLSYARLEQAPQQWPFPEGAEAGRSRLYLDHRFATPSGRARFQPISWRPPVEWPSVERPLQLSSGRLRDQWHSLSRSGTVPALFASAPEPRLALHPEELSRQGLAEGELAAVNSARGRLHVKVTADPQLGPRQAWLPMHWGSEYLLGRDESGAALQGVNALSQSQCCPDSGQPELKFAAIGLKRLTLPWRVLGAAQVPEAQAEALHQALLALGREAVYACCVPVAGVLPGQTGWQLEAAFAQAPDSRWVQDLTAALALDAPGALRYADGRRGPLRLLRLQGEGERARLQAWLRVSEVRERQGQGDGAWLDDWWREGRPVAPLGRQLLAPQPLGSSASASPVVCQCLGVRESAIVSQLRQCQDLTPSGRLQDLQSSLRCGTQCGSCLPQLRRLAQSPSTSMETSR
ncbi:molybdopterin-dependent oxidoreductase [Mitsuaria sp. WAJ17]|uniref:nitrate reductase n=1 Tax=Mitsuaria sp. WAJ17 TaxID=2761452 RepID=UPI001602689F|nr:molybdopterin-dependent oxidoreductase [Mitsuaria sp. WAJ17]MBB2485919.1 molybdopterin-dependent oxidoreductase [Mitsuaria sp. WAJ17]